jgi:hypothetical protein
MRIEFFNLHNSRSTFFQREKEFFLSDSNRRNDSNPRDTNTIAHRHIIPEMLFGEFHTHGNGNAAA